MVLSIEEVESIRLSDYLEMEQDSATESMNVSRGTFQRIINVARKKTADALVHGKTIRIDWGNYELSAGKVCCRRYNGNCKRKDCEKCEDCEHNKSEWMAKNLLLYIEKSLIINREENNFMKIAVATEGTNVSGHFGKCENFTIAEIENSTILSKDIINTLGNQHGLLPTFLASHDVNVVIAGGMGEGARQNLISNDIQIISGASGNVDEVINAYLKGNLKSNDVGCSSHEHSHDDGHGESGCNCGHN